MTSARPNLFLVGAPRSGTTALHSYLAQHPDVFMSEVKEPHFFCTDFIEECDEFHGEPRHFPYRTTAEYEALFAAARSEAVIGESSVYYLMSVAAAREIAAYNPAARILLMLREPVEFLYSLYAKFRSTGDEDAASFARALELEGDRSRGVGLPRSVRMPAFLRYSEAVQYTAQLERYRAAFAPGQIKVIVFDDFRRDAGAVYGDVLDFLGLQRAPLPQLVFENSNVEARSVRLTLVERALSERYMAAAAPGLLSPVRRKLYGGLHRLVERANQRVAQRTPLEPALQSELKARFKPEVERLSDAVSRDLISEWGYGSV